MENTPKVVIAGAGFAGLWAARALAGAPVRTLLLDANNFHTFQPLLYQVATAGIEPEAITYPVRGVLRNLPNAQFLLTRIESVDADKKVLLTGTGPVPYDYLILATGAQTAYLAIPGAADHSFSLKNIDEAVHLRNHILCCFERAVHENDASARTALLTFAVVGGGATGVEFAGAIAELIHGPVLRDYPQIRREEIRLFLVEYSGRLLNGLPAGLGEYARKRLEKMGVAVRLNQEVVRVAPDGLYFRSGEIIRATTVSWLAGVSGCAPESGLPRHPRNRRVAVGPTLQVERYPEIFVAGDLSLPGTEGAGFPMVAPVAIEQGIAAAENIRRLIAGKAPQPFRYRDKGTMVTIGRNAAVAKIGKLTFTGFPAWMIWLLLHLVKLIGFRSRLIVLINWAWDYLFVDRAVRLILPSCQGLSCRRGDQDRVCACGEPKD